MKDFVTAAKTVAEKDTPDEGITRFKIDGKEMVAYKPEDGQLILLMATTASHSNLHEKIAGVINFFVAVLDEKSHHHIVGRLMDRDDDFGIEEVTDIMHELIEEWSGNPTEGVSGSSPSRSRAGQKSTRRTPVSTS
jgi:hypothetical protein